MSTAPQQSHDASPAADLFGLVPQHPLSSPTVIVTTMDGSDEHWHPFAYFVNGYQRHHEKLSGMAGDWRGNAEDQTP